MSGEWIEWKGGESSPVPPHTYGKVEFRDKVTCKGRIDTVDWRHHGHSGDIIAYKVCDPYEAEQDYAETPKEERPHNHYHKDVSKYSSVDVYRVLDLFGVTDQAIGHAAKKLLCAGQRGHKDLATDVQNVIDTLERWKEMRKEDAKAEIV